MQSGTIAISNGWALYGHPLFLNRLESLVEEVESLVSDDPKGFHPACSLQAV
jgi:toxin YhaV